MSKTIAITKQWQLYIPEAIRKAVGLDMPTQATIEAKKGKIVITPQPSPLLQQAGKYHRYARGKDIDLDTIRDTIDYAR